MPAPIGAHVFKNATVTVDSVAYANQCNRARLVPDTPIQTFRTLVPDGIVQDVDSTSWTLELAGLQIWASGGLAQALNDAAGTQVEVVIEPVAGGSESATCTIIALPLPFGGDQGQFRTFEASFPVVGEPEFEPAGS